MRITIKMAETVTKRGKVWNTMDVKRLQSITGVIFVSSLRSGQYVPVFGKAVLVSSNLGNCSKYKKLRSAYVCTLFKTCITEPFQLLTICKQLKIVLARTGYLYDNSSIRKSGSLPKERPLSCIWILIRFLMAAHFAQTSFLREFPSSWDQQ